MGEPTTAAPGPANPLDERTCRKCNETKPVSPETWVYRRGKGHNGVYQAHGALCLLCERKRKAEYDKRRDSIAQDVSEPPVPDKGDSDEKRKALTAANKLDVAKALKAGSKVLNEIAPSILARMIEYVEDPDDPHHEWALEFFAQRILPRKLYEELGGQAAGVGALSDRRPQFVLNILPASPDAPQGAVYENEPPLLPAPAVQIIEERKDEPHP